MRIAAARVTLGHVVRAGRASQGLAAAAMKIGTAANSRSILARSRWSAIHASACARAIAPCSQQTSARRVSTGRNEPSVNTPVCTSTVVSRKPASSSRVTAIWVARPEIDRAGHGLPDQDGHLDHVAQVVHRHDARVDR